MSSSRRTFLRNVAVGTAALTMTDGCKDNDDARDRMPVGFVGHGSPMTIVTPERGEDMKAWAGQLPRPKAILVVSAHWQVSGPTLAATETVPLIYDFYGFPDELYRVKYPAPGAPEVAARVRELVPGVADEPDRGLDHGVWAPLVWMYPDADVPVLQLALPRAPFAELYDLGKRLAPLRSEGVFVLGSGNVVHNLRSADFRERTDTPDWARAFDAWCEDVLSRGDTDALLDAKANAPRFTTAHPTHEHFDPLVVAAGAGAGDAVTYPITGFELASISRRSVQFG